MRTITGFLCAATAALVLALASQTAHAWPQVCDFLTGGGYIFTTASGAHPVTKGTFAIGGGCKDGSPTWGHLEYHDHYSGLNAHWTTITAYLVEGEGDTSTSPKNGQPTGTRLVCGVARTNTYGDVDFMVRAHDEGEPGTSDQFDIRLSQNGVIVYSTENEIGAPHELGDGDGGGGNIQLHKPNPSTTGEFGGSCPARAAVFP